MAPLAPMTKTLMLSAFVLLSSFIEHLQVEAGEPCGVGEDVDLDDPSVLYHQGSGATGRNPRQRFSPIPRANLVQRRLDFVARPLLPAIRRPDRCVREDDPLVSCVTAGHMHCGAPHMVRGRQGSCSCASQTSSGSSARTRS